MIEYLIKIQKTSIFKNPQKILNFIDTDKLLNVLNNKMGLFWMFTNNTIVMQSHWMYNDFTFYKQTEMVFC